MIDILNDPNLIISDLEVLATKHGITIEPTSDNTGLKLIDAHGLIVAFIPRIGPAMERDPRPGYLYSIAREKTA